MNNLSQEISAERMIFLVKAQLEAYNKRDLDLFCSYFHPEIKTHRLLTGEGVEGMEKFKQGFKKLFESSPNLNCEIKSQIILKNTILDEEWITGASTAPDGLHAVAVYAFRDNLIDRIWFAR